MSEEQTTTEAAVEAPVDAPVEAVAEVAVEAPVEVAVEAVAEVAVEVPVATVAEVKAATRKRKATVVEEAFAAPTAEEAELGKLVEFGPGVSFYVRG